MRRGSFSPFATKVEPLAVAAMGVPLFSEAGRALNLLALIPLNLAEATFMERLLLIAAPVAVGLALFRVLRVNQRLARFAARQEEIAAALRTSEERWNFALEGARDGVWDWDIATNTVFFSKRWKAMLGYAEDELSDRFEEWTKRIHPDDLDAFLDVVQRYLRGETPEYEVEHRVGCKDGSFRWLLARGKIVSRSAAGKPLRMVGTHTDITERKRSEQALQSAKIFAEELIETANAIVIGLDPRGVITIFNQAAEAITGFAKEEMLGRDVWEVLVPRARFPEVVARIGPDSPGGLPKHNENPILTKSGEVRFIAWQNGVLHEAGRAIGTISFGIDITERRRVEEELRRHEEHLEETIRTRTEALQNAERRLRQVTDNLPGAVYQFVRKTDGNFAFTFCSEGFEKMAGVRGEDAIRDVNTVWASIHPDDLQELFRRAEHSSATMTRYVQDLRIGLPDGRCWWIRAESDPLAQPDGSVLWNGNIMDITERKRLEEELAIAKGAAEAANVAKSAFLANMSHEIRTPMNAILGFSRLLLRDPELNGVRRQNLETIHRSGEHLLSLINDILEMSKVEAGRIELRQCAFDLHATLADLERMFRLRAEERHLRFAIECAGDVPQYVYGDEARLRQIFINLIGNSVKFTERGGVFVRVSVAELGAETVRVKVEVADTGPGIEAEELPRLFRQFEQAGSGRKAGGGTGLGLAISREFVRLMGGEIGVVSEPGHGSTFRFELQLGLSKSSALQPKADERRVLRVLAGPEPVRVLIADDRPENVELMQQTLRSVGFETRVVSDGSAAVELFAAWRPHVILMDLRMPGLDGCEAIRRIRQLPDGAAVAIIAVTASAFEEDRRHVLEAGGNDFLGKPFREPMLFDKIKQHTGIEYEYASGEMREVEEARPAVTARDAVALAAETRTALREAAVAADLDRVLGIVTEMAPGAPALAAEVRRRVEQFDYPGVLALIETNALS